MRVTAAPSFVLLTLLSFARGAELYEHTDLMERVKDQMLGAARESWEQGTAALALLEWDTPMYSLWGSQPFGPPGGRADPLPDSTLRLAVSAVAHQGSQGRLAQSNGDGAALDGASNGRAVLLGQLTQPSREAFWRRASDKQLNYLLHKATRTSTGALSHRTKTRQYWADGVYMAFPFIAYDGAVYRNQSQLQFAYDQCRLYRNALITNCPTGKLWRHIYSDDSRKFPDGGLWATGNGWAAKGMIDVAMIIQLSEFDETMLRQKEDLLAWVKEILDGTFAVLNSDDLVPNYIDARGSNTFGDASASAALAGVAYRAATNWPGKFGNNYASLASKIRQAVTSRVDTEFGVLRSVVDPLSWDNQGTLSTEAQAFALQMWAAWRDWSESQ
ncbi:hypothetical protein AURDEDRAFT_109784 [Auricularia subglabra TFB-10046 SS5]|nr:hypothetical protein AURDEDRAFT_109784 [Auricularia subglabra TFB-10046 SS5]